MRGLACMFGACIGRTRSYEKDQNEGEDESDTTKKSGHVFRRHRITSFLIVKDKTRTAAWDRHDLPKTHFVTVFKHNPLQPTLKYALEQNAKCSQVTFHLLCSVPAAVCSKVRQVTSRPIPTGLVFISENSISLFRHACCAGCDH